MDPMCLRAPLQGRQVLARAFTCRKNLCPLHALPQQARHTLFAHIAQLRLSLLLTAPSRPSRGAVQTARSTVPDSAPATAREPAPTPALDLAAILAKVRAAMNIDALARSGRQVMLSGRGTHLGGDCSWTLRWQPDGSFLEEVQGNELSYRCGRQPLARMSFMWLSSWLQKHAGCCMPACG